MNLIRLPFDSSFDQYQDQSAELMHSYQTADPDALNLFKQHHPRFLDPKIPWLSTNPTDAEVQNAALTLPDTQLAIARWYHFLDWQALTKYADTVTRPNSPVFEFESAVEAVINGDLTALESALRKNPDLVRARSTRITHFDPPGHRSTLLHYLAANGVEGYRQKSPKNAVTIAETLLRAGAEVDSLASLYGGECTTMALLVSSCHPANAGVQVALVETLLDFGAAIEGVGTGKWVAPLMTALAFGYLQAAEALVRRGAKVDNIVAAAGLGRITDAQRLLPASDSESRHRALAVASQLGHANIVKLLLEAGEDPNRFNPDGNHSHSTPLHQAALAGHAAVVRLLVERGARLDIEDTIYHGTPVGWAEHGGQTEVARYLVEHRGH